MRTTPSNSPARPCKELVRAWLFERHRNRKPLPDLEEIRRALGWVAIPGPAATSPAHAGDTCRAKL
ncbi:hypothetical protein [Pseudoduganella namucuonensis]|uniref:Uncharacterized protein n=1 Tax=Pseudoduganella namucuonensis TaxID=1035707 RepID=A0A1I7IH80_9BURK|nr:hypothetical protein [Pseudoduganella namucuonensis]SFU72270.1 hypothetical protein SAMN05216552_100835 [Pseudoduganella namucuonensis]